VIGYNPLRARGIDRHYVADGAHSKERIACAD
jgi:hypothetical protein